jgi:MFS family permease
MGSGIFLLTVGIFLRIPLVVDMADEFELSALAVGGISSAFALGRLLTDIPAGKAVDALPLGRMMAGASLVIAIAGAVMASAPVVAVLFIGSFIMGVGSASTLTASFAFFATAPKQRRGRYLSMFAAAMLVGQAIGPAVGGWLAGIVEWRGTLVVGAVAALVMTVVFGSLRALHTEREERSTDKAGDPRGTPLVYAVLYGLPAVQFGVGATLYQTLLPLVGADEFGFSTAVIGYGIGVGGLCRLVAALVAGRVSDGVSRKAALIPGVVLQFAGVLAFAFIDTAAGWWLSIVLLAFGSVVVNVGSTILADLTEGASLGTRLGRFRFTGDATFLVLPVVSGALFEGFGRGAAAAPSALLVGAVMIGVLFVVPETHNPGAVDEDTIEQV